MHKIKFRVYYEDTDAGNVMYYANYLKFAERARTEWLREFGYEQSLLNVLFVVKNVEIEYFKPARLDDEVTVETQLQNIGRASITMTQEFFANKTRIALMKVVLVCVDRETIKPTALPQEIKDKIIKQKS